MTHRLAALLFCCALTAQASAVPGALSVSYRVPDPPTKAVLESVLNGHRAEITYELRLYRPATGLGRVVGDRLVAEREIVYTARWDPLNERYVVQAGTTQEATFEATETFLSFFFRMATYLEIDDLPDDSWYVICRARIEPVRLVPPLTLLALLDRRYRFFTPWERIQYSVYRL